MQNSYNVYLEGILNTVPALDRRNFFKPNLRGHSSRVV